MSLMRLHESMELDDLVDRLRRVGHIWLKNDDLLLLEELIRRAQERGRGVDRADGR